LAKTLRDDRLRFDDLKMKRPDYWRPIKDPDTEEELVLRARIAEIAKTISCPAHYGFEQRWDDWVRLRLLRDNGFDEKNLFLPKVTLYDVEDVEAERTQLMARIEVFDHSPEGRTRARINELQRKMFRGWWMSVAEHAELDQLMAFYPEPWCHPNSQEKDYEARRYSLEERKRAAQEDLRTSERARLYRAKCSSSDRKKTP
jgi:hypothetical protein